MIRDFRGHKAGIKDLETGKAITVSSVLRFIFNHFEDFVICHDIVLGIQGNIFSGAESYTKTLYGLYQSLGNMDLSLALYTDIEIDDCDTTTLNDQYKNYFGQNEWKKSAFLKTIILIIWQAKVKTLTSLKKKWECSEYLKSMNVVTRQASKQTKNIIKHRQARQKSFETSQNVEVCDDITLP